MLVDAWEEGSALIQYSRHTVSCKFIPMYGQMFPSNISIEPIMDILKQVGNREGLSSSDVEDRLNVENELPTSPQLSDEQILESVVGQSSFKDARSNNEEDEGQDEPLNVLKSVYHGWNDRTMLTLF